MEDGYACRFIGLEWKLDERSYLSENQVSGGISNWSELFRIFIEL
jgi:hypothetical protein